MAVYPLQPLLSVRHYRETAAQNALLAAERTLIEAEAQVSRCRQELERYRAWRMEEEERRYDALMGEVTDIEGLERFRNALAALRNGDLTREQAIAAAEKHVLTCRKAVQTARDAVARARREVSKIAAHKDIWMDAERREAARLEDIEMEEFKVAPPAEASDDI